MAQDVDGFPVLVRLDSTFFDFSGVQSGGKDIRFTLNTGTTPLPYHIESFDATSGTAAIWVLMDVKGNEVETLVLHSGNATTPDAQSAATVFDSTSGFGGVWHLDSALSDATGNGNIGSGNGNDDQTGIAGSGHYFSGSDVLQFGNDASIYPSDTFTASVWLKTIYTGSATTSILRMNSYYTPLQLHRDDDTTTTYEAEAHSVAWTSTGDLQYAIFDWNGDFADKVNRLVVKIEGLVS